MVQEGGREAQWFRRGVGRHSGSVVIQEEDLAEPVAKQNCAEGFRLETLHLTCG